MNHRHFFDISIFHLRTNKDLSAGCSNSCTEFSGLENKYIWFVHWSIAIVFLSSLKIIINMVQKLNARTLVSVSLCTSIAYMANSCSSESVKIQSTELDTMHRHTKNVAAAASETAPVCLWLKLYRYGATVCNRHKIELFIPRIEFMNYALVFICSSTVGVFVCASECDSCVLLFRQNQRQSELTQWLIPILI